MKRAPDLVAVSTPGRSSAQARSWTPSAHRPGPDHADFLSSASQGQARRPTGRPNSPTASPVPIQNRSSPAWRLPPPHRRCGSMPGHSGSRSSRPARGSPLLGSPLLGSQLPGSQLPGSPPPDALLSGSPPPHALLSGSPLSDDPLSDDPLSGARPSGDGDRRHSSNGRHHRTPSHLAPSLRARLRRRDWPDLP